MFEFIKKLFRKPAPEPIDPDLVPEELWIPDFRKSDTVRFLSETGEHYHSAPGQKGFTLSINKKNIFAWSIDPLYRYRDFVMEALIEFPSSKAEPAIPASGQASFAGSPGSPLRAGRCAAGFLFRSISDSTFYSILVSDSGMVRMESVINGNPVPILGWTEIPPVPPAFAALEEAESGAPYTVDASVYVLRVIARSTTFTIILNDRWIAECQDDTIQAPGKIAFAAQNWNELDTVDVTLRAFALDSRPVEIEAVHSRWNDFIPIPPEARVNLARTWYAMGKYVPAIIELKKAWKDREPESAERLLAAQVYLTQRLLPEAESEVRKALAAQADSVEAAAELGGILYLENRFVELDQLIASLSREAVEASAFISNLEGHVLHWKGDRKGAAKAYSRAAALAPDQGLFLLHAGNEHADSGDAAAAVTAWLEAARLFLADENYDDLGELIPRLAEAAPDNPAVLAIEGKYRYALDDTARAHECLEQAARSGTDDSAVWYLLGLLVLRNGNPSGAIAALEKAIELEDSCALYYFRLAETLFYSGRECDAAIENTIDRDPSNGWIHNLAALKSLGAGELEEAEKHITEARKLLPAELPVLVNFAEIKRRQGKLDDALPLLDTGDAEALHAAANLLAEDGRSAEADEWYRKALRQRPFDAGLLTDCAANCLELDMLNEADDLLGRAMDQEHSARMYRLVSFLASRKGEHARAEVALLQAAEEYPKDADILADLAMHWMHRNKREKAEEIIEKLKEAGDEERAAELGNELARKFTEPVNCALCGREWRVPRDIPTQASLRIRDEPPDDLPAGTCSVCGKTVCIGCAKHNLGDDGRFRCAEDGVPLKLSDHRVIWLLSQWQAQR